MKSLFITVLPLVSAWPGVMEMNSKLEKRYVNPPYRAPTFKSNRPNTGAAHNPPAPFVASEQYVDVTPGSGHEFMAPTTSDLRGECPGLNAAANHGFLPRNGLPTIADTVTGLGDAYNMSPELAAFLAVVAIAYAGDPVTETWSIGGAFPNTLPYPAHGILGTHNQYEGDASIMRGDAYLNGGNVGVFQDFKWNNFVAMGNEFTLDNAAAQSDYNTRWSILNNPYYFSAPFAGLVAPAAHNFVINFMSNHSAEVPGGTLTLEVLQSFFAITGTKTKYTQNRGMERIPDNWYKRPTLQQYNAADVFADLAVNDAMYPGSLRFGGNTGKTNSFVGIAPGVLSDNLVNAENFLQGDNAVCFMLQVASIGLPDATDPIVGLGTSLLTWFEQQTGTLSSKYGCPQLKNINTSPIFQEFPGASFQDSGTG